MDLFQRVNTCFDYEQRECKRNIFKPAVEDLEAGPDGRWSQRNNELAFYGNYLSDRMKLHCREKIH